MSRDAKPASVRPEPQHAEGEAGREEHVPSRAISSSEARRYFTSVLKDVEQVPEGTIGVTVRGRVQAYLVSRRRLEYLEALASDHERRRRLDRYRRATPVDRRAPSAEVAEERLARPFEEEPSAVEPEYEASASVQRAVVKLLRALRKAE